MTKNNLALRFLHSSFWAYQPILINGRIVRNSTFVSGQNAVINARYKAVKKVISQLGRPLKILDIGANNGFFSFKLALDFPDSHCVMIDDSSRLTDICVANTKINNVTYLRKKFLLNDLYDLSEKEQFDVILCLNVLHHVDDFSKWLATLKQIGHHLIVETPPLDDKVNISSQVRQLTTHILNDENYELLGRFPRGLGGPKDYLILIKGNEVIHKNIGIKLSTFFYFNGTFPNPDFIQERYGNLDTYSICGIHAHSL